MKKKQANLYNTSKKRLQPPYLSKEQLQEFESQYTLFDRQLSLKKLKEIMAMQQVQGSNLVGDFIDSLLQKREKYSFEQYIQQMTKYLQTIDDSSLINQMLGQKCDYMEKQTLKQLVQQTVGREIMANEINQISKKIFQTDSERIPKHKIIQIMERKYKITQ